MNRALMAAGLVDRVQVTLFPAITGQTGLDPIFQGAADFDLELLENRTLDGRTPRSSSADPLSIDGASRSEGGMDQSRADESAAPAESYRAWARC
jgi:hypothetical protein